MRAPGPPRGSPDHRAEAAERALHGVRDLRRCDHDLRDTALERLLRGDELLLHPPIREVHEERELLARNLWDQRRRVRGLAEEAGHVCKEEEGVRMEPDRDLRGDPVRIDVDELAVRRDALRGVYRALSRQ